MEDRRLAIGHGLTGGAAVVTPLVIGVASGHPVGGSLVALGAWLITTRTNRDPAGVRTSAMIVGVLSLALGAFLGQLATQHQWLLIPVAPLVAGLGILVPWIGPTAALALLITASIPSQLDPLSHLGLQLLGGLVAAVVLTLPWPWRISRPLSTTVAEAAQALADMIDATLSDDWEDRRAAAGAAIGKARIACGRYRWERRSRDAERVTAALRRAFYEAVALRQLCLALERRAPSERAGMPDLLTSLSASVRSLFQEVRSADPELTGYTARVDALRGERPADERELMLLVLLRQAGHAADRVREVLAEVEPDARSLALSVLVVPRLPGPAGPRARWSLDDPTFRHALRVALGIALACVAIVLFKPAHAEWLAVTALLTIQPTYGETMSKVWSRVLGTVAGALVAALILWLAPGQWWLTGFIGVSAALAFGLFSVHYAYFTTFMTMTILVLIDFQQPQGPQVAGLRVVLTVLGCGLALACTRLLWPRGEAVRLRERLANLLDAHAAAARALAEWARGRSPDGRAEERIRTAADEAGELGVTLTYMKNEPHVETPEEVSQVLTSAQRVRDDLITVISVLRADPGEVGPAPQALDAVAERLAAGAEAVRTEEPYQSEGDVDGRLADVGAWLGELADQRLDELAQNASDTRTDVRRSLFHAAAAHLALRALGSDSAELVKGATVDPLPSR